MKRSTKKIKGLTGDEIKTALKAAITVKYQDAEVDLDNQADRPTGDRSTGYCSTGYGSTGSHSTGDCSTGNDSTGNHSTGSYSTGHYSTGYGSAGNGSTGEHSTGNGSTGYWSTSNYSTGHFCTVDYLGMSAFNKPCSVKEWENAEKPEFLYFDLCVWVATENMTDEEKANNPTYKTTEGYLKAQDYKEAFTDACKEATPEDIELLKALPNYDASVFEEISGYRFD